MRLVSTYRLVDAFADWGLHEAPTRLQLKLPPGLQGVERIVTGAEVALTRRSPFAWRILAAWPIACFRIELTAEDVPLTIIADGRLVSEWTDAVLRDNTPSGNHVRDLARSSNPVAGPLLCTSRRAQDTPADSMIVDPPLVIFDGWHRAAAWIVQGREGRHYPIIANLVVTQHEAPLWRAEQG